MYGDGMGAAMASVGFFLVIFILVFLVVSILVPFFIMRIRREAIETNAKLAKIIQLLEQRGAQ